MHVVATAGHVDHGKSTLVRALTGMEPDRLAEEQRRGLTIDLGYAWTTLEVGGTAEQVAFVDVPGHERFVPTMLAGVGPVPVAVLVVAADSGWMPQSAEHLQALDALGVRHGLLVITRSDLADPEPAREEALAELAGSALAGCAAVAVSAVTGEGLPRLRAELAALLARVPVPDPAAPVRLWVDRSFTVRGSGTVVTGTLPAGSVRPGDELEVGAGGRRVRVRSLQCLGERAEQARGVARVALNLRGVERAELARGDALLTPGTHLPADCLDVRVVPVLGAEVDPRALPQRAVLHVGSAAVGVRLRVLGQDAAGVTARLSADAALPLRVGDRALLRDPGAQRVCGGVVVLDVRPPALARRGAGRARAQVLAELDGTPDEASEVARRRLVRRAELTAMGVPAAGAPVAGDWLADPAHWSALRVRLAEEVRAFTRENPLEAGAPLEALRRRLGLPDRALVEALVAASRGALGVRAGRVVAGAGQELPPAVAAAVSALREELAAAPFAAPTAERLAELRLGTREVAAAARAGRLLRLGESVVLAPGADTAAARALARLPQPFTLSEARRHLSTSRRVAVPLLELLDRRGLTRRLDDDRRTVAAERLEQETAGGVSRLDSP
ncbi:selenocysteine-specific elongation factor [Kineococcus xinjiangensis]|uniref:Selenocysteine-specific elongation factor n=1 Tax=Kineococcus xinjiangensis TaxID=512762 RepID=A0A2S6ID55_9ACTN|nr:selenocysteine-specific translation elongation factor [Kineococcus xinjiangensis]PPK92154.1 selenocysteine-specific elongation factor [Kineococcus xinjiangensis]